jgi:hypothetical protein
MASTYISGDLTTAEDDRQTLIVAYFQMLPKVSIQQEPSNVRRARRFAETARRVLFTNPSSRADRCRFRTLESPTGAVLYTFSVGATCVVAFPRLVIPSDVP